MAKWVFIYDDAGISRVERRETPWKDTILEGKKAIDVLRNVDLSISQVDLASEYGQLGAFILEAHQSDRFSEAEKQRFTRLLYEYDFITDSIERQTIAGDFDRTHPVAHPTDPGPRPPEGELAWTGAYDP